MKNTKILIVDDHPLTRAGVRSILEANSTIDIIGEAGDGREAVAQALEIKPDIIIMDITMPQLSGIDATKEILEKQPDIKIIALSIHSGQNFVKGMLDAGAVGYLLKEEVPEELVAAIKKVELGDVYLSSAVTRAALSKPETEFTGFNILKTKLLRPSVTGKYIVREYIVNELEQNVLKPFSLVSAGAGFGKSVAVSLWLEQTKVPYVWISLDEEHNDLRTFLFYLIEGIELVVPEALKETRHAFSGVELPPFNQLVNIFFNDLCELGQEIILVLDNYHKINNAKIHDLFNEWLRFPPPNIHLCLITRRDPPLNMKSLKLSGRMTEIRMEQLSFSNEEIVVLFRKLLKIELSDQTVKKLHDKTEGWIIGLRLATMIIKTQEDVDEVLNSLKGGLGTISDYLLTEVLSKVPVEIKNKLLSSSILNRFNRNLLDEFSNAEQDEEALEYQGEKFIDWLINANMFVIDLDLEGEWFRYHHLFQELLNSQLSTQFSKEEIDQLNHKACNWFEQNGYIEEAIQHAVRIKDYKRATQIIEDHRLKFLEKDEWFVLERIFSTIPESIVDSTLDLLLVKAHIVFYHTDLVGLSEQVAKIEKLMEKMEKPEELPFYGEFVFYQAHMYLFFQQDIVKTYELLSLAMILIPDAQAELRGRTELLFSLTAQMHGKYEETYADALKRDKGVSVNHVLRNRRYLNLMWLAMIAGHQEQSAKYNINTLEIARAEKQEVGIAWSLYTSALIYTFKGQWQKAIVQLEELMTMKYIWYTMSEIDVMVALITSYQLVGETDKARNLLKDLELYTNDLIPFYQSWLWAAKARYYTLIEDKESLREIIGKQEVVSIGNPVYYYHIPVNVECQALVFEGSDDNLKLAEEKLQGWMALYEGQHNVLHWVELLIIQAILFYKQERYEESIQSLLKAIDLGAPGNTMVYFVEMGKSILDIVSKMTNDQKEHPHLQEIISTISSTPLYQEKYVVKKTHKKEKSNLLTKRELDVLQCIADGLRNQEIAEKLFNSEETIKKHIYHMFQKLQVKNRLSLVTKAKEEGILE